MRILVPSRRKDGAVVDPDLRREWDGRARKQLETSPFGGSTPIPVWGSFVHEDGRVTREQITVLTASCSKTVLQDQDARARLFAFAKELCAALGQESIFIGWGDLAYVVSAAFVMGDIPVVPFSKLRADAQAKHLTMGWGGIDDPSKILQVLSLDTWTLPDGEPSSNDSRLVVRAVLHEPSGVRRAWSWTGDLKGVKAARKSWKGTGGPRAGDLVFLRSRRGYIDVVLVTPTGVSGPRDLRESHGQMNPVTRQVLWRILHREWPKLESDLGQKPLSTAFFPKLRVLQKRIQDVAAATQEPREAFRYSVRVVGRMMFLRFLAQKGWLAGGVDELIDAHSRHGNRFFSDYVKPLWFDVLNTPEDDRPSEVLKTFTGEYPYLNGGLFQPRPEELAQDLPAALFDPTVDGSFLQLFRDFEFSLNEYAGSDESLRVDPSLFGQVLESFNSDAEKKVEGVHYTPKTIARSLALESILARIALLTKIDRRVLDGVLRGERNLSGKEARRVREILGDLRVIDPAVGSGALLWACLEVMLELDSACQGIAGGGDGYHPGSHDWGSRSRHFVCNCLYGVDISEEAIELARLRLWLAVALSEDTAEPLPDLELNICRGDSLLRPSGTQPTRGRKAAKNKNLELGFDERTQVYNEYLKLILAYLKAGEHDPVQQRQLRADALALRSRLAAMSSEADSDDFPFDWNMYFPQVFREEADSKHGFDIVIANPPYVRIQNLDRKVSQQYRSTWDTLKSGNADLSFAFIELALRHLAAPDGGQVAFIQPNFRHHDAGETVRAMLLGKVAAVPARLRLWVDFDDAQVFPTATNYVAMLFAERLTKASPQPEFTYSTPEPNSWKDTEDIAWLRPQGGTDPHPADGDWLTLRAELRTRVLSARERLPAKLGDLATVEVGVQTSKDPVYLFEDFRDVEDRKLMEVRPEDSKRWVQLERGVLRRCRKGAATADYYLLFPYDAKGELLPPGILEKRYPHAWKYLCSQKKTLEARESGKFKGDGWYRFGRPQGFVASQLPKVLVPSTLKRMEAIVDADGSVAFTASGKGGGGTWALRPRGDGISLEDLVAIVKTDEAWDHVLAYGSPQRNGWRGVDADVLAGIPCAAARRR